MKLEEHMHLAVDEIREIAAEIDKHYADNDGMIDAKVCMDMAERQYI